MVVRINFKGTTGTGPNQSTLSDYIDLHTVDTTAAKRVFLYWVVTSSGIRGASGVFHPTQAEGSIKMTKVVEQHA